MHREIRLLSILGALCSMPQSAIAQDSFVGCPVQLLDTAVVSKLPDGWWATPQQGELLTTQVMVVGGQATLVCRYAGFGAKIGVMREPPARATCTPAPGGFTCRVGLTPLTQSSAEVPVVTSGLEVSGRVSGPSAPSQSGERQQPQVTPPNPNLQNPGGEVKR